jgi:hypothetical protein
MQILLEITWHFWAPDRQNFGPRRYMRDVCFAVDHVAIGVVLLGTRGKFSHGLQLTRGRE